MLDVSLTSLSLLGKTHLNAAAPQIHCLDKALNNHQLRLPQITLCNFPFYGPMTLYLVPLQGFVINFDLSLSQNYWAFVSV